MISLTLSLVLMFMQEPTHKDYELLVFNGENHYIHKSIDVGLSDIKRQESRHFERVKNNLHKWKKTKSNMKRIYFSKNGNLSIFNVKKEHEILSLKGKIEKYRPSESYIYEGFGEDFEDDFGGFENIKSKFKEYSNQLN